MIVQVKCEKLEVPLLPGVTFLGSKAYATRFCHQTSQGKKKKVVVSARLCGLDHCVKQEQ